MTTIGVLSDTHINLFGKRQIPPIVFETFENVDLILHAGDLNVLQVISDLEVLAPVHAVRGNNEDFEAVQNLKNSQRIIVEDCVIGLVHGDIPMEKLPIPLQNAVGNRQTAANALSHFADDAEVNCIVFGHSHHALELRYTVNDREILLFNPGSPTDRRYAPDYSCGLLRVDGKLIEAELIRW